MELDEIELKRLKELLHYKVLSPTPDEICDEIERLHSIIKEIRELVEQKIKGYMEVIDMLKTSSVETKKEEIIELKYRIREQEEFLEILDKEKE